MIVKISRSIELLLWTVAAVCFGATAWGAAAAFQATQDASKFVTTEPASRPSDAAAGIARPASAEPANGSLTIAPPGQVIGRIHIGALGLSVPITTGIETSSLLRGVGHVEGTALPGGLGTLALAGHRDTYLRPLEHVEPGMDIEVIDVTGTYHYIVDNSEIVTPQQVDVLSIRSRPELVLITCYPFHYVGAAPDRFVVHAHLVSLAPDARPSDAQGSNASR